MRSMVCCLFLIVFVLPRSSPAQDEDLSGLANVGDAAGLTPGLSPQMLAEALLPTLGKVMGLDPKRPVTVSEEDREDLRAILLKIMQRQYPGDTLERMNQAYQAIGLVPPRTDLRGQALALYQGQVAGFYDPTSGKLALVSGASTSQQAQVLQHELAHALQDQYYSLQKMIDAVIQDEDQALALQAVIEGQAVVAMFSGATQASEGTPTTLEGAREALSAAGMEVSDDELRSMVGVGKEGEGGGSLSALMVPDKPPAEGVAYLQAQLLFPYQEGTRFVEAIIKRSNFSRAVKQTLGKPPRSTAEVLHPELYEKVPPKTVKLPHFSARGRAVYNTTVGELNIRTLCGGAGVGDSVAAGWRGDHLTALSVGDNVAVGWITVWSSEADATAFAQAMRDIFERRKDSDQVDAVKQKGASVAVLATVPRPLQAAMLAALAQDME